MAKVLTLSGGIIASGTAVENYIEQITAGETTHDIAVKQGITFLNGATDQSGLTWNGTAPFEVVIPTVADIVQDPVRLVGVINSSNQSAANDPQNGNLVYIEENCTFAGQACEAGDMAVYATADSRWHVITGENQVVISGGTVDGGHHTVAISGTATKVLEVEGKNLNLAIDYSDVRAKVGIVKNNQDVALNVANGTVAVSAIYLGLTQGAGSSKDISVPVSIDLPTALANGAVTINESVLVPGDFTFNSGTLPSASLNDSAITVTASHNMSIGKVNNTDGDSGDYVTSINAIKAVGFTAGTAGSADITYVTGLTTASVSGHSFVTDIRLYDSTDTGDADLVIAGIPTINAENNTFAYGWGAEASTGEVISSINVGAVTANTTGSDFLTGLTAGSTVVTSVSFGDLGVSSGLSWFLSGLGESSSTGDVVTDVTIGAVTLVSGTNNDLNGSAMVSASVSNHVLSFSTGSFMKPVTLSKTSDTVLKATFNTAGVILSNTSAPTTTFTKGGITQADTTISYKSLASKAVTLTAGTAVSYVFDSAYETVYDVAKAGADFTYTNATVSKNTPKLENTAITASIAANSVVVGISTGTLPTFTVASGTGTLTGSVGTSLTTSSVSWLGVNDSLKIIDSPGDYTLGVVASDASGALSACETPRLRCA